MSPLSESLAAHLREFCLSRQKRPRQVLLKTPVGKCIHLRCPFDQESGAEFDGLQHGFGPSEVSLGVEGGKGFLEREFTDIGGGAFAGAADPELGFKRQLPQHTLQIYFLAAGLGEEAAQLTPVFRFSGLDLLPAPQEDIHRLFVEFGPGLWQLPFVGVDQGHHCEQQRVGGQSPEIGPSDRRLEPPGQPCPLRGRTNGMDADQVVVPGRDEIIDLLVVEGGQADCGKIGQLPIFVLIREDPAGEHNAAFGIPVRKCRNGIPDEGAFGLGWGFIQAVQQQDGAAVLQGRLREPWRQRGDSGP